MPSETASRPTRVDEVYDRLRRLATGPNMVVGDRLQSVRTLAVELEASVPTILRAMARLESEGVLQRRHGAGIYVASPHAPAALSQAVTLCIEAGSDVFGELAASLVGDLQAQQQFVNLIDTSAPTARRLLLAMSQSAVGCLVVHGHLHFPFEVFRDPAFRRKPIIGVVDWEAPPGLPDVVQVVSDYAAGARLAAAHLWELGHRHLLVVGTAIQVYYLRYPSPTINPLQQAFISDWERRGGTWQSLASNNNAGHDVMAEAEVVACFKHAAAPTAVFGLRDLEVHLVQRLLRRQLPAVAARTALLGYYDTPWSAHGDPPISTISLNIPAIAAAVLRAIAALAPGHAPATPITRIRPRLVVRATSIPRA